MASPLMVREMAIAQTTTPYPQYGVTAQHDGGNCLPVRSEPRPDAFMVACVSNGAVLKPIVGEKNGWIQIESGNWTWKNSTSLKVVSPPPESTSKFPIYGAVIQSPAGCSNVRKTPSAAGDIAAECLSNGAVLKPITGEQGGWYQLSSGNWIIKDNVQLP